MCRCHHIHIFLVNLFNLSSFFFIKGAIVLSTVAWSHLPLALKSWWTDHHIASKILFLEMFTQITSMEMKIMVMEKWQWYWAGSSLQGQYLQHATRDLVRRSQMHKIATPPLSLNFYYYHSSTDWAYFRVLILEKRVPIFVFVRTVMLGMKEKTDILPAQVHERTKATKMPTP